MWTFQNAWHSIMECKALCSYNCCKVPRKLVKFFKLINAKNIRNAFPPNMGYYFIWWILWCNFLASSLLKKKKKNLNFHFIHLLAWNLLPISQRLQCPNICQIKKKFCIMKIYECFMHKKAHCLGPSQGPSSQATQVSLPPMNLVRTKVHNNTSSLTNIIFYFEFPSCQVAFLAHVHT